MANWKLEVIRYHSYRNLCRVTNLPLAFLFFLGQNVSHCSGKTWKLRVLRDRRGILSPTPRPAHWGSLPTQIFGNKLRIKKILEAHPIHRAQKANAKSSAGFILKYLDQPWPGSSAGGSVTPTHQGCRCHPHSEHARESTSDCVNKRNNNLMLLSLSLSLPLLKSTDKNYSSIPATG